MFGLSKICPGNILGLACWMLGKSKKTSPKWGTLDADESHATK